MMMYEPAAMASLLNVWVTTNLFVGLLDEEMPVIVNVSADPIPDRYCPTDRVVALDTVNVFDAEVILLPLFELTPTYPVNETLLYGIIFVVETNVVDTFSVPAVIVAVDEILITVADVTSVTLTVPLPSDPNDKVVAPVRIAPTAT